MEQLTGYGRWAWQHPQLCRHIGRAGRNGAASNGQENTQKKRQTRSLVGHLADLHRLLRTPYFGRWPLTVRILASDVHSSWMAWTDRVDGLLPDNIRVEADIQCSGHSILDANLPRNDMSHIDPSYRTVREHVEKSTLILDDSNLVHCGVCHKQLSFKHDLITVCPRTGCRFTAHMTCLSKRFLEDEGSDQVVPVGGECPGCGVEVSWSTLMKDLSLRLRGQQTIEKMLQTGHVHKSTRNGHNRRSTKSSQPTHADKSQVDSEICDDDELDDTWLDQVEMGSEASDNETGSPEVVVIDDSECDG